MRILYVYSEKGNVKRVDDLEEYKERWGVTEEQTDAQVVKNNSKMKEGCQWEKVVINDEKTADIIRFLKKNPPKASFYSIEDSLLSCNRNLETVSCDLNEISAQLQDLKEELDELKETVGDEENLF